MTQTGYQKIDLNKFDENWKKILTASKKEIVEAVSEELEIDVEYRSDITHVAITVSEDSTASVEVIDNNAVEAFISSYEEEGTQVVAVYTVKEIYQMRKFTGADMAKWAMDLIKFQFAA